jgi:hypothetical protein
MLRPRLLRAFGWRVTTVLAKDWYESPQRELQRLLGLLEGRTLSRIEDADASRQNRG